MTRWILGSELPAALQDKAKRRFVHRFTGDHRPQWASLQSGYAVQFKDDTDWLANSKFAVTKSGQSFDERVKRHVSHPTWPQGNTLGDTMNHAFRSKEGKA